MAEATLKDIVHNGVIPEGYTADSTLAAFNNAKAVMMSLCERYFDPDYVAEFKLAMEMLPLQATMYMMFIEGIMNGQESVARMMQEEVEAFGKGLQH